MKSIRIFLTNIRNLLPYLFLIAIYFFFVNIEARKENNKNQIRHKEIPNLSIDRTITEKEQLRLTIPVIPYEN